MHEKRDRAWSVAVELFNVILWTFLVLNHHMLCLTAFADTGCPQNAALCDFCVVNRQFGTGPKCDMLFHRHFGTGCPQNATLCDFCVVNR